MRLVRPERKSCDRARFYASLRVDGELSELESRLLAAHLGQCGPCRAFGADVEAFTAALRAAPIDPGRPVEIPWRRRSVLTLRSAQLGAAALALVAVGLGGMLASMTSPDNASRSAAPPAGAAIAAGIDDELVFEEKLLLIHAGRSWALSPVSGTSSRAL
jgi:anti-sigma factor RsiW